DGSRSWATATAHRTNKRGRAGASPGTARAAKLDGDLVSSSQSPRLKSRKGGKMAWNIEGTYSETCSCELICPCNASFSNGASYDFCRALLVFNITSGEI